VVYLPPPTCDDGGGVCVCDVGAYGVWGELDAGISLSVTLLTFLNESIFRFGVNSSESSLYLLSRRFFANRASAACFL